jgi:hypothetical protein
MSSIKSQHIEIIREFTQRCQFATFVFLEQTAFTYLTLSLLQCFQNDYSLPGVEHCHGNDEYHATGCDAIKMIRKIMCEL